MTEKEREAIKLPDFIKKIEVFTYGLLYPAFFGNMIYDLIQAVTEKRTFPGVEFYTGLLIVLFYALDYIHLYADVESFVNKDAKVKNWVYIGCDILTSCLFFASMVCLKYSSPKNHGLTLSIILIGAIPAIIAIYKQKYFLTASEKSHTGWFGFIAFLIFVAIAFLPNLKLKEYTFFLALAISLGYYLWYIFVFFKQQWARRWPDTEIEKGVGN